LFNNDTGNVALFERGYYKAIIPHHAIPQFYKSMCAANPAAIDQITDIIFPDVQGVVTCL
jgi:hypothetical protein